MGQNLNIKSLSETLSKYKRNTKNSVSSHLLNTVKSAVKCIFVDIVSDASKKNHTVLLIFV